MKHTLLVISFFLLNLTWGQDCFSQDDCSGNQVCITNTNSCDLSDGGICTETGQLAMIDFITNGGDCVEGGGVCGCNGLSYTNHCIAVFIDGTGITNDWSFCEETSTECTTNDDCQDGFACIPPTGDCDFTTGPGECIEQGGDCTGDYFPVCGCNGDSYSNLCQATIWSGTGVDYNGICSENQTIGAECFTDAIESGYYNCDGICRTVEYIDTAIGDGECYSEFDCPEFGFDCGECYWSGWFGDDPLDFCDNYMPIDIGDECLTGDGNPGIINCFYQCTGGTWLENIGEGGCEEVGQHPWNCEEYGWDCGDCNTDWDGSDPLGFCDEDYTGPTWHITTDGSDETGDGSTENPFATIQHGINTSVDGDTIQIGEGIFIDAVEIYNKSLTIIGNSIDGTVLKTPNTGYLSTRPAIKILATSDSISIELKNLTIRDSKNGVYSLGDIELFVTKVNFDNNSGLGAIGLGAAITFDSNNMDNSITIINSIFQNNSYGLGAAFYVNDASSVNVTNCTFVNNGQIDEYEYYLIGITANSATFNNNIFIGNHEPFLMIPSVDGTVFDYNLFYEDEIPYIILDIIIPIEIGSHNIINTDPLFTDSENGDFTLQPNSPCIDAGDPNSPLDPDGTVADMGAFYYHQEDPEVTFYLGDIDYTNNTVEVWMDNSVDIGGAQLWFTGFDVGGASGGLAQEYGWEISGPGNSVILFDLQGSTIPPGNAVFFNINLINVSIEDLCISDAVASNINGEALITEIGDCIPYQESTVFLSLENMDYENQTIDIMIDTEEDIAGSQLWLTGLTISDVESELLEECMYTTSFSDNTIITFGSMVVCPQPQGLMYRVSYSELLEDEICIINPLIPNDIGEALSVDTGECFSVNLQHFTNIINGYEGEYLDFQEETGAGTTPIVYIESSDGVDIGDEIGLFDIGGVIGDECPPQMGEVLVGASVYNGGPMEITTYGAIQNCEEDILLPGFISGNEFVVRIWKAELDQEFPAYYNGQTGALTWSPNDLNISMMSPGSWTNYDVNLDNELNILDIVLTVSIILGEENEDMTWGQEHTADTNSDGLINVIDILIMINTILTE